MPYTGPFPFAGSTSQILVSNTSLSGGVTNSHHNTTQFIDLINVTSAANVSATFSAGVLRVSSGTTVVAAIHLAGAYVTSNFHIGSGIGGSVAITDPAVPNGGGVVSGPGRPSRGKASICRTSPSARTRRLPIHRTRPIPAAR
jgi:hypothetical protein